VLLLAVGRPPENPQARLVMKSRGNNCFTYPTDTQSSACSEITFNPDWVVVVRDHYQSAIERDWDLLGKISKFD
jgi:hypothetical protein